MLVSPHESTSSARLPPSNRIPKFVAEVTCLGGQILVPWLQAVGGTKVHARIPARMDKSRFDAAWSEAFGQGPSKQTPEGALCHRNPPAVTSPSSSVAGKARAFSTKIIGGRPSLEACQIGLTLCQS